jgi:hypothetical protein
MAPANLAAGAADPLGASGPPALRQRCALWQRQINKKRAA